jgi:hypothetical protein
MLASQYNIFYESHGSGCKVAQAAEVKLDVHFSFAVVWDCTISCILWYPNDYADQATDRYGTPNHFLWGG